MPQRLVGKIFDNVESAIAPDGNDAGFVELRIEQVIPVRRGLHEGFRGILSTVIVGYVFARVVVVNPGHSQPLSERCFACKLVRKLRMLNHHASVRSSRLRESF